jgi:hypothetical protein
MILLSAKEKRSQAQNNEFQLIYFGGFLIEQ